jgi:uncharacterized protein (DUF305 family)
VNRLFQSFAAASAAATLVLTASNAGAQSSDTGPASHADGTMTPAERAHADNGRPPYTAEDLHFMQGMIGHHAQAVVMAGWAASHGASPEVQILCKKIDVAQRDEIATMQQWLRDRKETVPQPTFTVAGTTMGDMPGMSGGLMPGMLNAQQMAQLDSARGKDFDRLFLTDMIQHHEGALTMVQTLFDTKGSGNEDTIFKFASDVNSDQMVEIERMQGMLDRMQ